MILPGLSGAFILLLLGVYEFILNALIGFDWPYILVFMMGCATGLLIFTRVLSWMLRDHHQLSYGFISGMLLGSVTALWPWQGEEGFTMVLPASLTLVLGVAVVVSLQRVFAAKPTRHSHSLARFDVCHWQAWRYSVAAPGVIRHRSLSRVNARCSPRQLLSIALRRIVVFDSKTRGRLESLPGLAMVVREQPAQRRVRSAALLNPSRRKVLPQHLRRVYTVCNLAIPCSPSPSNMIWILDRWR